MQGLKFASDGPLSLLFLGAHCDDIEIGCGGTILELVKNRRDASIRWVVLSGNDEREKEALASARQRIANGS